MRTNVLYWPVKREAVPVGHVFDTQSAGTENRSAEGILYGVLWGGLLWLALILAL